MSSKLLRVTDSGFYCEAGDFYVDPWQPVSRAIITHAHSDHARLGSEHYLCAATCQNVLRARLGPDANISTLDFGERKEIGSATVTLHPAGHILGSAQVEIELAGKIAVVSGDYKRQYDATCCSFSPVRCHIFVTESTFGLPVYQWPAPAVVFDEINRWWSENQRDGKCSIILSYSLGKAQRILAGVDPSIGPVHTHGAVEKLNAAYRASDITLPPTIPVANSAPGTDWSQALVIAPPSAAGAAWTNRFGKQSVAMASGWMLVRGVRRRRSLDRGFIVSDHVDWPDLLTSIDETKAEEIWVTHGYSDVVVKYLREKGLQAHSMETRFVGDSLGESGEEDPSE